MKVPEPFEVHSPEGRYVVEFDEGTSTDSFPIICHPYSLKREIIRFLNSVSDGANYFINVLLIQKNHSLNSHLVLPLMARIWYEEHDLIVPLEEERGKAERVFQFQQFVDQLSTNGELDFLHNDDE